MKPSWFKVCALWLCLAARIVVADEGGFHARVAAGDVAQVKAALAEKPALVHVRNAAGATPLHIAAAAGYAEIVRLLLAHGADVDARDETLGATPLMVATVAGKLETAKILIAADADVERASFYGNTALHLAAYEGRAELVRLLINIGADPEQKNQDGFTPFDLAQRQQQREIAALLSSPEYLRQQARRAETRSWQTLRKQIAALETRLQRDARAAAQTDSVFKGELVRLRELKERLLAEQAELIKKLDAEITALTVKATALEERLAQLQRLLENESNVRQNETARLRETMAQSLAENARWQVQITELVEQQHLLRGVPQQCTNLAAQSAMLRLDVDDLQRLYEEKIAASERRLQEVESRLQKLAAALENRSPASTSE